MPSTMLTFTRPAIHVAQNSHTKEFKEAYLQNVHNAALGGDENNAALLNSDAASDKPNLILDIDETLMSVRTVCKDILVSDEIGFGGANYVVKALKYDLKLKSPLSAEPISAKQQCADNTQIPRKGAYAYFKITDANGTLVTQLCQITEAKLIEMHLANANGVVFALPVNDAIAWNIVMPQRCEVQHGAFRAHLRPGLGAFLKWANKHFNVVLFTAAIGSVYGPLMQKVHALLCAELPTETRLWNEKVLFRTDCDLVHGGAHTKNIFGKGFLASRSVIADNNWISFYGSLPNAVGVRSYRGEAGDNHLIGELKPILDRIVGSKHADVRYALNNVQPSFATDSKECSQLELASRFFDAWDMAATSKVTPKPVFA